MSKYVRGIKRNQIIQRWLQGVEDPEYEVFPTKKEGKYIVKLRENPIVEECVDTTNSAIPEEPVEEIQIHDSIKNEPKTRPTISSRTIERTVSSSDPRINLEILEQLRNLGEEIRNDRFKKEQKQYIKQIINKELNKSRTEQVWQGQRIRSKYVPDLIPVCETDIVKQQENEPQEPQQEAPVQQEPQQEIPKFKSRIRR